MTFLVLLGLIAVCAKLWFDVGDLRARLATLEHLATPGVLPDMADPIGWTAPVIETSPAPPPPDTSPIAGFEVEPPTPIADEPAPEQIEPSRPVFHEPAPAYAEETSPPPRQRGGFEELFGRKLPIWAGGVTLAVAGFLIVKYSIDSGLLSPAVRVFFGLLFGGALIAGAEVALRADGAVRDPRVRQALSGAGIATLYASILVAANLYHLVGPIPAFVGMALTTVLAGALSLRFGAPSAILGLVGGLAAPALVGSGSPDVPLLSAYLALTVGGLTALSRTQRWMWLGVLALIGGFGWGALLILGGALDLASTLSVGAFMFLLGIGLPLIAFGRDDVKVRLLGSLLACAQLAALVAIGGFAPLEWSLYALISIAMIWLSRREAYLAELPAAGLAVALALIVAWPAPDAVMLGVVLTGIALVFGLPTVQRMWRDDARLSDAIQLAVIALAIPVMPSIQLTPGDGQVALLSLLGAVIAGGVATLGWRAPNRKDDPRFAILVATAGTLVATAAAVAAPDWCAAPAIALVALGLLTLAGRADDRRIDRIAAAFGGAAVLAAMVAPLAELGRAAGSEHGDASFTAATRWAIPALAAIAFAWRSRLRHADKVAQPLAVLLAYIAIAQVAPPLLLPLIPVVMLGGLTFGRRVIPATIVAGALAALWAAWPLGRWVFAGCEAVFAEPMLIGALPDLRDTLLRLALPAAAAAAFAWRQPDGRPRRIAWITATIVAGVSLHILYKNLFAITNAYRFVVYGMAERTLWEMILAAVAIALWRRTPRIAQVIGAASVAHFAVFTLMLHDPLWSLQAVGGWPVANMLLPAFGTAFALVLLARRRLTLPPLVSRALAWLQMVLILTFATATLRQLAHGSLLSVGSVGEREDIARSAVLILLAIGFLRYGIAAAQRDWRIASLMLMLVAVAKVFLIDVAGLDGLLRIASFAALGFSLIGIGWLYSRYLPEEAVPVKTPEPV